jgi:hypothetical protein
MFGKRTIGQDVSEAASFAKGQTQQDGLFPLENEYGEQRYTAQQGVKAACLTREDVIAVMHIQTSTLRRLKELRTIGLIGLALLAYIAWCLS